MWGCMHECIEKELERIEAMGRFECLIKVLALHSNHGTWHSTRYCSH